MNFLNKMERKFGKYAIQNLTFWLIGAWILGFIIQYTMPEVQKLLILEPALILRGQVWRIVSWLLVPPPVNLLFLIFFLSCYYFIGNSIEQAIGTFRYNVYLIGGLLCSVLGAFLLYGFYYVFRGVAVTGIGYYFSTEYITMSLFMAFAVIYPNVEFRLYFLIPIKAKWMVIGYGLIEISLGLASANDGVAHFAHLGGMIFGLLIILYWKHNGLFKGNGGYY